MAETNNRWSEPKSDYKSTDQVLPNIFNELATNEKHLKEIACEVLIRKTKDDEATEKRTTAIVLVQEE